MTGCFVYFLSQSFSAVRFGCDISSFKQTKTRIPQVTVIIPVLFHVFINDLLHTLTTWVDFALFAGGLVIWNSASQKNQDSLNKTINSNLRDLECWCKKNAVIVNKNKSSCQFFTLNRQSFPPNLTFKRVAI